MKRRIQTNPKLHNIVLNGKTLDLILQTCAEDNSFIGKCCDLFGIQTPEYNAEILQAIVTFQDATNDKNAANLLNTFVRHFGRIYFYDSNQEAFSKYENLQNIIEKSKYDELLQHNIMHHTVMIYNEHINNKKDFIKSCFKLIPSEIESNTQKNIERAANGMYNMLYKFFDGKSSHDIANKGKNIMRDAATKPSLLAWSLYILTLGLGYVIDRMFDISHSRQASSFKSYATQAKSDGAQIDISHF